MKVGIPRETIVPDPCDRLTRDDAVAGDDSGSRDVAIDDADPIRATERDVARRPLPLGARPIRHRVDVDLLRVYRGRADGDEIVVEGVNARGQPQRWIFSRITSTSFHWRNIVSDDDGKSWQIIEQVDARRVTTAPAAGVRGDASP